MSSDIKYTAFLSHSSKDIRDVTVIRDYLETCCGYTCFMSGRDLEHSSEWQRQLVDAMDSSRIFIYVHSGASNASSEVAREINYFADKCRRPILVYRLSDVQYASDRSYYLQSINYIDSLVSARDGLPALAADVRNALERSRIDGRHQDISHTKLFFRKYKVPVFVAVAVLIMVSLLAVFEKVTEKRKTAAADTAYSICLGCLDSAERYLETEDSLQFVLPSLDSAMTIYNKTVSRYGDSYMEQIDFEGKRQEYVNSLESILSGCTNAVKSVFPMVRLFSESEADTAVAQMRCDIEKINLINSILGRAADEEIETIKKSIIK